MAKFLLFALAVLAAGVRAEQYEYDYGYDGAYGDDTYSYLDDYGYYGNDDDAYYEEYGYYSDNDAFGYQDYYDDFYDYGNTDSAGSGSSSCTTDKDGKVQLANGTASCDIKISSVDHQAELLPGGLDGVYKLSGCHNSKPMYKREDSPAGEDRVLWYSNSFSDWDISKGSVPTEDDILMYGSDTQQHGVPLFVESWQIAGDLMTGSNSTGEEVYLPVQATLKCADGKVVQPPPGPTPAQLKVGPILTHDEMEAKYKQIYERYGRRPDPNPNVNFSFVIMLVMVGLTIVLAIPYLLVKRGRLAAKGYQPVSTTNSFAQVIQQSKKKQSGHIH